MEMSNIAMHFHTAGNPYDAMTEDELLMAWKVKKTAIDVLKNEEMELRKYIVGRAFPKKQEGMNTRELGNGYQLKASVKYNYNLGNNELVETCLAKIAELGNDGSFIADRLVSWKPTLVLSEYRQLMEDKRTYVLAIINEMLTITEGAPTLEIKEPKK
jgi:hypothetical protein